MKLTTDAVVFSYFGESLYVLLIKRNFEPFMGEYSLPGGYVLDDESTDFSVLRKLKEETNVELDYLEQLYTFGDANRDPRGRVVSVAYYGLINPAKHDLIENEHATSVEWVEINDALKLNLAFDHHSILVYGFERLQNKLKYEPIGFDLLTKYFSMTELWMLYCSILGKPLDRGNFVRKINSYNLLKKTSFKKQEQHMGRKAQLFEFNTKKYEELKIKGINFEL